MRLAEYRLPSSKLTITENSEVDISSSGSLDSCIWIHTPPLSRSDISKIWGMQLSTLSANQGWVGNRDAGCWSWFEIAIYTPVPAGGDLTFKLVRPP